MSSYSKRLTKLFEQVEPQFRADTVARYVGTAKGNLEAWLNLLKGPEPPRVIGTFRRSWEVPNYVDHKDGVYPLFWLKLQEEAKAGKWTANVARAARDANNSVDYAKHHFISKQSRKLENATKLCEDRPSISGKLVYNVLIEGTLRIKFSNGSRFDIVMSMIVNHRYERGFTQFYQFPARFTNVVVNESMPTARTSEKWMSENFHD